MTDYTHGLPQTCIAAAGLVFSSPPVFADAASAALHERAVDSAHLEATAEFVVKPRCSVRTISGKTFAEGEAITPEDVKGDLVMARRALRELVAYGVLFWLDEQEIAQRSLATGPARNRYQVSPDLHGVISTARGKLLGAGRWVTGADFVDADGKGGEQALQDFVRRGLVIDTTKAKQ